MLFCTFRYRTAAHLHFMKAAAAQLDVRAMHRELLARSSGTKSLTPSLRGQG